MPLRKILSGGQTGVDLAALRAGRWCGLNIGGWCPPGRTNEAGNIPEEFSLDETPQERSPLAPDVPRSQRTEWNIRDADATLILKPTHQKTDPGTEWAIKCTEIYQKPLLITDPYESDALNKITNWMESLSITTLSIGGPSEKTVPGIEKVAFELLTRLFCGR